VDSAGSEVTDPEYANGIPDGKSAQLGEYAVMILTLGREAFNGQSGSDLKDLVLGGAVLSTASAEAEDCSTSSDGAGAFQVDVSLNGSTYYTVGLWTAKNNEFDIGCASLPSASMRFIRLTGQPGASARLDGVTVKAHACTVQ
jgi:hypothetical protein